MQALTLTRPDDWHLHVRDGATLDSVVPDTARRFARAIIMPNLKPPVTSTEQALAYRERILNAVPAGAEFTPLMTLYLTETTTAAEIERAKRSAAVYGVKLYPAGATTHSDAGVRHWQNAAEAIAALEQTGLPLLIHGEVTDPAVDIFDREKIFIEQHLIPLLARFPNLKVVLEHVTTAEAVDFIRQSRDGVAATITPQHLLLNRNAMLAGGIRPHHYCLPVLKRERHRQALVSAATSGSAKFFLGTDSAPHARHTKETACGCAGIYSAHAGIELYAMAFEQADALDKLEGFASFFGADFYGLPRNSATLTLEKQPWTVPESMAFGDADTLIPFYAGSTIPWRVQEAS